MLQLVLGKFADGVPQLLVSMVSPGFETSRGMAPSILGQNHTLMKVLVRSMAYQPPPSELKGCPKLLGPNTIPHPALLLSAATQSVERTVLK